MSFIKFVFFFVKKKVCIFRYECLYERINILLDNISHLTILFFTVEKKVHLYTLKDLIPPPPPPPKKRTPDWQLLCKMQV